MILTKVFLAFRANQSPSHDSQTIHVAENQEGRRKRADRQAGGAGLLPADHPAEAALHGAQEEDQDRGSASGPRVTVAEFGDCLKLDEPCHAVQKGIIISTVIKQ